MRVEDGSKIYLRLLWSQYIVNILGRSKYALSFRQAHMIAQASLQLIDHLMAAPLCVPLRNSRGSCRCSLTGLSMSSIGICVNAAPKCSSDESQNRLKCLSSSTWATFIAFSSSSFDAAKLFSCFLFHPNRASLTLLAADFVRFDPFRQSLRMSWRGDITLL